MLLTAAFAALVLPLLVFAASESTFVPLAPIPNLKGTYEDISQYLDEVFTLTISVAAILAVIMIIYHGIQYMLKEAITEKKGALDGVRGAVFGLILLLMSWLILFVINPQILDLHALKSSLGGTSSNTETSSNASPTPVPPTSSSRSGVPWAINQGVPQPPP